MAIVNAKEMMLKATAEKYAVGAFNCTNLIQMEAVVEAAIELNAPLIVQACGTLEVFETAGDRSHLQNPGAIGADSHLPAPGSLQ